MRARRGSANKSFEDASRAARQQELGQGLPVNQVHLSCWSQSPRHRKTGAEPMSWLKQAKDGHGKV